MLFLGNKGCCQLLLQRGQQQLSRFSSSSSTSSTTAKATTNSKNADEATTSTSHKYGQTLILPKTKFPMRAEAVKREPGLREHITEKLYLWQHQQTDRPSFVLHDGPPYANGPLHIGHAMNRILKDVICRYKVMKGHRVDFVPGWDCHGLPIELEALRKVSSAEERQALTPKKICELAQQSADAAMKAQKTTMQEWCIMADWNQRYCTMDASYAAEQLRVFGSMVKKGLIFRGNRAVYWSPSSRTALAEAELEYHEDHVSTSIYVRFPVNEATLGKVADLKLFPNLAVVAWTTTPWTIPANKALCVHEDLEYCVLKMKEGNGHVIVASILADAVAQKIGANNKPLYFIQGSKLVGISCFHPINSTQPSPIFTGEHVTSTSGTGIVHTAPGHGFEDAEVGQQHGLECLSPVDGNGCFTAEAGSNLEGVDVLKDGNTKVIELLQQRNNILFTEEYHHRYPYDWRTKKPVIIRTTEQWFIQLEPIKDAALSSVDSLYMYPAASKQRLKSMLGNRSHWCISRQRAWGVPIPVFYHKESRKSWMDENLIDHVASLIERFGTDCWWTLPMAELIPKSRASESEEWERGTDTMDVWFDSGTSWAAVLKKRGEKFPADLYLEGSDQHRGWFQSSLLTSIAVEGTPPYRGVLTHGFVLDGQGRKMSKSIGNVVSPESVTHGKGVGGPSQGFGVDVLRFWAANSDYSRDAIMSKDVVERHSDFLRKIRNTIRFILSVTENFDPNLNKDVVPNYLIDTHMLRRIHQVASDVNRHYENLAPAHALSQVCTFISSELSTIYFEAVKDCLYSDTIDNPRRKDAQFVLWNALNLILCTMAPAVPHTVQDAWLHMPTSQRQFLSQGDIAPSIFHVVWPIEQTIMKHIVPAVLNQNVEMDWVLEVRSAALKAIETARNQKIVGSSLQVCLSIVSSNEEILNKLSPLGKDGQLAEIMVVSDVVVVGSLAENLGLSAVIASESIEHASGVSVQVNVHHSTLDKCQRCWKYLAPKEEELCPRCTQVLATAGRQ